MKFILPLLLCASAAPAAPAQTFRDCSTCPEMVCIPAGKFDITRGQWAEFVEATKRPTTGGCAWAHLPGDTGKPWVNNPAASWTHLGFEQGDDHPVVWRSWQYDPFGSPEFRACPRSLSQLLPQCGWWFSRSANALVYY